MSKFFLHIWKSCLYMLQKVEEDTDMYDQVVQSFQEKPRDVHTIPLNAHKTPLWFHVFAKDGILYVTSAKSHLPSSNISGHRSLPPEQFETMLDIYHRRQKGERVSQEATEATRCQVYWYGVFADMGF